MTPRKEPACRNSWTPSAHARHVARLGLKLARSALAAPLHALPPPPRAREKTRAPEKEMRLPMRKKNAFYTWNLLLCWWLRRVLSLGAVGVYSYYSVSGWHKSRFVSVSRSSVSDRAGKRVLWPCATKIGKSGGNAENPIACTCATQSPACTGRKKKDTPTCDQG